MERDICGITNQFIGYAKNIFQGLDKEEKVDYNGWKTSSNMNLSKTLQACNSSESFCN